MNRGTLRLLLAAFALLLTLVGCGDEPPTQVIIVVTSPPQEVVTVVVTAPPPGAESTPEEVQPPPAAGSIEIVEATFAHGLSEEMQPVDPSADFQPAETIYLSLRIKGRPDEGVVTARFYWHDSLITEAGLDLADVNSGLLFSIGEDTYAGYTVTHEEPFPLSDQYHADVYYNEQPLGSIPFRVVPPAEAIASQVTQVTLALGASESYDPIEPTTTFAPHEEVFLVGEGDLGTATWLQVEWFVNGQEDEAGTRSLTLEENVTGAGFVFSFLPEGGWPTGEHFAVVIMNDQEVGRYSFSVVSSGSG